MYNPPHFTSTDPTWLDWLAEHHPFGTLVSQVEDAPFASHLPVLYKRTDGEVTLTGHWARPNPQWREIETQRALFLFQGPHAYISPRWYADTPKQVPTWNYVAAHVYGTIRLIQEGPELEHIVVSLAKKFESGATTPWSLADSDPANRARLRGIVGFELRSTSVQVKLKLNQNHPVANVAGVIAGLRDTGSEEAAAVAALMQKELDKR
ncbi:MAG TPA: FMN-binding negative transcriptional regulator [Steroidobacteraceae bacterium]|jgi:transcriptional regulator|nr:FMN-binding negative transcriptional regulator [Steroidobacteraceae bacterium]